MGLIHKNKKEYFGHINIISYNCDNEYRRKVHEVQLKLLKDFIQIELEKYGGKSCITSVNILYQNYTEEQLAKFNEILKDFPVTVNSISVTLIEKKGPAYARNQLLKLSYKTDDDFFILMDDDVMAGYPGYTFIDYLRQVFFKHFNEFGFISVRANSFIKSHFNEYSIKTENNPFLFGGAFQIWKNPKKYNNIERWFDEKFYIGEDVKMGLENLLLGIPVHIIYVPGLKDMASAEFGFDNSSLYPDSDSAISAWRNAAYECCKEMQEKYDFKLLEKDGTLKNKTKFYDYVSKSKNILYFHPIIEFNCDHFKEFYKPIMRELRMKKSKQYPKLYKPKNIKKWYNPYNVTARSSWEYRFMEWADFNESVIEVGSENVVVKYFNPIKKKEARYYVDFKMKYRYPDGKEKTVLIEIKPFYQTQQPVPTKDKNGNVLKRCYGVYTRQVATYLTNVAKWEAAKKYAKENGYEFWILTEKELPIK